MFRAHRAHHQERQIVSIQPLVAVGGRVVCRSEAKASDLHTTRQPTATRGCIDTICLSWWWARCARNMQSSVSQTVVRGPQVVLRFCPCGPFRL